MLGYSELETGGAFQTKIHAVIEVISCYNWLARDKKKGVEKVECAFQAAKMLHLSRTYQLLNSEDSNDVFLIISYKMKF